MGGQACVFYGAAQFSKDVDLAPDICRATVERYWKASENTTSKMTIAA